MSVITRGCERSINTISKPRKQAKVDDDVANGATLNHLMRGRRLLEWEGLGDIVPKRARLEPSVDVGDRLPLGGLWHQKHDHERTRPRHLRRPSPALYGPRPVRRRIPRDGP